LSSSFGTAGNWWLTPVILDTQEAEIRRIKVQSQPGLKNNTKMGWRSGSAKLLKYKSKDSWVHAKLKNKCLLCTPSQKV
jgi:hypothetical protein